MTSQSWRIAVGRHDDARQLLEECRTIFQKLDARKDLAGVLNDLGELAYDQGEHAEAMTLYDESLALATELGDRRCQAAVLHNLGRMAHFTGDERTCDGALQQEPCTAARARRQARHRPGAGEFWARSRSNRRLSACRLLFNESLALAEEVGDQAAVARCLEWLARVASCAGSFGHPVQYPALD